MGGWTGRERKIIGGWGWPVNVQFDDDFSTVKFSRPNDGDKQQDDGVGQDWMLLDPIDQVRPMTGPGPWPAAVSRA